MRSRDTRIRQQQEPEKTNDAAIPDKHNRVNERTWTLVTIDFSSDCLAIFSVFLREKATSVGREHSSPASMLPGKDLSPSRCGCWNILLRSTVPVRW